MKKRDFIKMLKEKNETFNMYKKHDTIANIAGTISIVIIIILRIKDMIPYEVQWIINTIILFAIVIPITYIELKNSKQIKKAYKHYQNENELLETQYKWKSLRIIIIMEILLVLVAYTSIVVDRVKYEDKIDKQELVNTLNITTKSGELIQTEYYDFDNERWYLKIPKGFLEMPDNSLQEELEDTESGYMYTNKEETAYITVYISNVYVKNSQMEAITRRNAEELMMEGNVTYTNFYYRDGHKIGEVKVILEADEVSLYNHMIMFAADNKLITINFACLEELQEELEELGEFILNSIIFA